MSRVAVIIPTYNDAKRLEKCLQALANQTFPMSEVRVYVVDNNSTENIKSLVSEFPFCDYLFESQPGAYHARNTALNALRDERFVAFTDADCIPESNWVSEAVNVLKSEPHQALGGNVVVFSETNGKPNLIELYEMLFAFPQKVYIEKDHFAVTANLFTSREVIDKNGSFNAALYSGGDAEWGNRLKQNGIRLNYAEQVRVRHPARDTFTKLVSKVKRTVGGCYQQIGINQAMTKSFSLIELIRGFMPPIYAMAALYNNSNNLTRQQKIKMIGLLIYLKYHKNLIKILYRLKLIRDFERF